MTNLIVAFPNSPERDLLALHLITPVCILKQYSERFTDENIMNYVRNAFELIVY
jgi:hypothetical protein